MKRWIVGAGIALGAAGVARAGCEKDLDCKGDRVCDQGACVDPVDPVDPVEPTEPPSRAVTGVQEGRSVFRTPGGYEIDGDLYRWSDVTTQIRRSGGRRARELMKRANDILTAGCVLLPVGAGLLASTPAFLQLDSTTLIDRRATPQVIAVGSVATVAGVILLSVMPSARKLAVEEAAFRGVVVSPMVAPTADGATFGLTGTF